ncbi:nitroreductase/quinone reductase family protein [Streptomyces sediminimaris]|uniref:nitroreductase/quinone reductase family protein n=1 Tax=Streptomyces sediminimaris TaxID=3383721 RepID=UPI00399A1372
MPVEQRAKSPLLPPRWFIRLVWSAHRAGYRVLGGRAALWRPRANGWGALRLTTTGRRTGRPRSVIIGYFEDGPNLVSLAMNGWGEGEPSWWLNLRTLPDATVDLVDGRRPVHAHAATGDERLRLWNRWREIDRNLDAYAARRPTETAVVVLEPRADAPGPAQESRPLDGP